MSEITPGEETPNNLAKGKQVKRYSIIKEFITPVIFVGAGMLSGIFMEKSMEHYNHAPQSVYTQDYKGRKEVIIQPQNGKNLTIFLDDGTGKLVKLDDLKTSETISQRRKLEDDMESKYNAIRDDAYNYIGNQK